jgi:hypothetical protein
LATDELLVTPQAFADYRGVSFDESDFHVVKVLEVVSGYVRREAGQFFTEVVDDEVELRGNWTRRLWLPERPATRLSAVSIQLPGFTTIQDLSGLTTVTRRGLVINTIGEDWGGPEATVFVTYDHGSSEVPPEIVGVVCAIGTRRFTDARGLKTSETMGPYSYTTAVGADGAPLYVTKDELKILAGIKAIAKEHV